MNNNIDHPMQSKHLSNAVSRAETDTNPMPAFSAMANAATLTDNDGPPTRERSVQTVCNVGVDAATQCNMLFDEFHLETEPEEDEVVNLINGIVESTAKMWEKENFLAFVQEKTNTYPNGKLECRLCGEISSTMPKHKAHLSNFHWGQGALCCRCGIKYPNERMLQCHACMDKPGTGKRRYRCPHFKCSMVAISLMELYDHINLHIKKRRYRCLHCRRAFYSAMELRYHLEIHQICRRKGASVKIYRYPGLHAGYDMAQRKCVELCSDSVLRFHRREKKDTHRLRRCTVCLNRVNVGALYLKHVKRCVKAHRQRLHRSTLKTNNTQPNGH